MSIMILMPANALSISLCTRSTSDLRNVFSCRSSDESTSSPSIEFECLKPNDISNLVNNCLADSPLGKLALYANERPLEKS